MIRGTPAVTNSDNVRLADVFGTGISGLLWSRDADGFSTTLHFLDFSGGVKPYLLNVMDNHIGATTRVTYESSTKFYLQDQQQPATRWKTPLPFTVQVVSKVEVIDAISGGRLTTEYSYHHGYWDGVEREFRGFGRVDQRDTEVFNIQPDLIRHRLKHAPGFISDRLMERSLATGERRISATSSGRVIHKSWSVPRR